MAETPPKRHREDSGDTQTEPPKRQRNEQIETIQDLSDFFLSISPDPFLEFTQQPEPDPDNDSTENNSKVEFIDDIRHLLEASDDELGIPSIVESGAGAGASSEVAGEGLVDFCLWELEDEAANYCTLFQSELFMQ